MAIAMVARQTVIINTPYRLPITITNNPVRVEVKGDMEYFSYDWQPSSRQVVITGEPEEELTGVTWRVLATYRDRSVLEREIIYDVVKPAPIFLPVPDLHLYRDVPINVLIPIVNPADDINANAHLIGLGITPTAEGATIDGKIPLSHNFSITQANFELEAPYGGGPVMQNIPYHIEAGTPPELGEINYTPKGDFAVVDFDDVRHAINYEWSLDEENWNRFGNNRQGIDLENLTVTPGQLSATVTFPVVPGATAYQYQITSELGEGQWTDATITVINNMIRTIIPGLEDGVEYTGYLRVSSPWIGTPVPVRIMGGRFAYTIHSDGQVSGDQDYLGVIHTGVAHGETAPLIKKVFLPTNCTNPRGIAIRDNLAYVPNRDTDRRGNSLFVFNHEDTENDNRATAIKRLFAPNNTYLNERLFIVDESEFYSIGASGGAYYLHVYDFDLNAANDQDTVSNPVGTQVISNAAVVGITVSDIIYISLSGSIHSRSKTAITTQIFGFTAPDDNRNTAGLSKVDNIYYTVDNSDDAIYIFRRDPDNLAQSSQIKRILLPSGLNQPIGLDIPI